MRYANFVHNSLLDAREIALRRFGRVTETTKPGDRRQVLTQADLEIGRFLIEKIKERYPGANIIDEEAGVIDKGSRFTFVIDPVDGTINFRIGTSTFGTILGLLDGEQPIAGGVVLPALEEFYEAERGQGAFRNAVRIHVNSETPFADAVIAIGIDGHDDDPERTHRECAIIPAIANKVRSVMCVNSVYDAMMVAQGSYGGFIYQTSRIWDNVGMQAILEEAGGVVTDLEGRPLDFSNPLTRVAQNYTVVAAAPQIHQPLLDIISRVRSLR